MYENNIWKLNLVRMFFWMHFFSAVLVPFYTMWGGLSISHIFIINSWFMLCNFLLEVPTGTVADFLGRKTSIAMGYVIGVIGAFVYVSMPNFYVFLVAEFIFAIAFTLHSGADEALAYDSLKVIKRTDTSKQVLATMESYKLGGIVIGSICGGFIATKWGLAMPMKFYFIPATLGFLISLTLHEPPVKKRDEEKKAYLAILKNGLDFFFKHTILILLTVEAVITNAIAWAIIWLYQPLLMRAGMSITYFGFVHSFVCITQIILLSKITLLEEWVGSKRRLLLAGSVLTGISYIVLSMTNWLPLIIFAIVVAFTFGLTRVPLFNAYMNQYIPSEMRSTVLSVSSMFRTLTIVVFNLVTGYLAEWSLSGTLAVLGVILIVVSALSKIEEKHLID